MNDGPVARKVCGELPPVCLPPVAEIAPGGMVSATGGLCWADYGAD